MTGFNQSHQDSLQGKKFHYRDTNSESRTLSMDSGHSRKLKHKNRRGAYRINAVHYGYFECKEEKGNGRRDSIR